LDHKTAKTELTNGVLWITLNRPDKLNAFNEQMGKDLLVALKEGEKSTAASSIVLTGEGRAFTVGEDINTSLAVLGGGKPALLGEALKTEYNLIVQQIRKMEKPVVAGVNGVTAGAGLGLVLACDIRAASNQATFHEAFIRIGLAPDSGMNFWLSRILGLAKATEVGRLREPIDSAMALNLGLVNWVFPDDRFREEVARLAERLTRRSTSTLALTKRALNKAIVVDTDSALEYETYLQTLARRTRDNVEGVGTFFEERDARFSG
jgi:2-(1,2-epoxy-1,2-dihydrophenyl)acetyl-CoA isomerase